MQLHSDVKVIKFKEYIVPFSFMFQKQFRKKRFSALKKMFNSGRQNNNMTLRLNQK